MKDRSGIAAVCLFANAIVYSLVAYATYAKAQEFGAQSVVTAVFAFFCYLVSGAYAIDQMGWAWKVSFAVFALNFAAALLPFGIAFKLVLVIVGALGIWANLAPGTKAQFNSAVGGAHA